jgi:dTDP-4-amino-4,6-dideoxygalactose transaminase
MAEHSVPFFDYPQVFLSQKDSILSIITQVGCRGAFILQQDLLDFEKHLAEYTGGQFALGVGNATDGLHLAVRAAGIGPGDEVIFCSHTMAATAAAIHFAGATPVPVECGPDHMIDPEAVEAAITSRTQAILPTQLNGRTCNMTALQSIADRHDLLIIEDAAQALGSRFKDRFAGTFGIASAISFYPAKNLGSLGDAGAVLTSDEQIFEKIFMLRDHGRDSHGEMIGWGLNSRLDNIQAAILDFKLAQYDGEVMRRQRIATMYQDGLGELSELMLPPAPHSEPDHYDVFQNYEIEADRRDELRAYLGENGVGTLIQWGGKAVHQHEKLGFRCNLPFTEKMFTRCLMLPMNTFLSDEDIQYVCEKVRGFYGQ